MTLPPVLNFHLLSTPLFQQRDASGSLNIVIMKEEELNIVLITTISETKTSMTMDLLLFWDLKPKLPCTNISSMMEDNSQLKIITHASILILMLMLELSMTYPPVLKLLRERDLA